MERRLDILSLLGGDESLDEVGVDPLIEPDGRNADDGSDPLGAIPEGLERDRPSERVPCEVYFRGADFVDQIDDGLASSPRSPLARVLLDLP